MRELILFLSGAMVAIFAIVVVIVFGTILF